MLPTFFKTNYPTLIDEFFGKDFLGDIFQFKGVNTPAVNICENADEFRIEVAAPGLEKNDFTIDIHHNILTISCQKEEKTETKDSKYTRREFNYNCFSRSFTLPSAVETDKISANHKDGILTIVVPKREEAKEKPKRQINIQ